MRQAGTLSNRDQAERLVDYLLTQGIAAKFDTEADSWSIWIRDEDQLPQAKELLQQFASDPNAEKYRAAGSAAETLRKQQAAEDKRRMKNVIEVRGRWTVGGGGPTPVTIALIAISIFVSLATNFGKKNNDLQRAVMFQSLERDEQGNRYLAAPSYVNDLNQGQLWRLVTPIFLHFDWLHLLFNMFWMYSLGSMVESRRGQVRFGLLVLAVAVLSNYGQYFLSLHLMSQVSITFGGMSGVNYGLFGYIWMKSLYDPMAGFRISSQTVFIMVVWFFVCWTGATGPVANWAHTVGWLVGMAIGYAPVAWRTMKKR